MSKQTLRSLAGQARVISLFRLLFEFWYELLDPCFIHIHNPWQKLVRICLKKVQISVRHILSCVLLMNCQKSGFPVGWGFSHIQGPVVQSIVSLTSLLRVISLTVLVDSIYNILIFFAEKMWVAFALQKLLTFFSKKFQHICVSLDVNFNESLTKDIISFEQLGPDRQ